MKRLLAVSLLLLTLAGCGQEETSAREVPDAQPQAVAETISGVFREQDVPLVAKPDQSPERTEEAVPVVKVTETAETKQPEPESEHIRLAAEVAALYQEITGDLTFTVWGTALDGTVTHLDITPEDGWNVRGLEQGFQWLCRWSPATLEEWQAQLGGENGKAMLCLEDIEGRSIACCADGQVLELTKNGQSIYLRAESIAEGALAWTLYDALLRIAEDAISARVWQVSVDGELSAAAAADQIAAQVAENYRNVPDWVAWKPLDLQVDSTEVYDLYKGEPQQFCCGISLRVKLEDFKSVNAGYWQAGAGLSEADDEGYYGWGSGVYVMKNETGDWCFRGMGTGSVFVEPPVAWENATVEQLVEVFCLTEGNTHQWFVPNFLLQLPKEELCRLPEILDQLTEAESRELCSVLGRMLREYDYWNWTVDSLKSVLGDYGGWLDV